MAKATQQRWTDSSVATEHGQLIGTPDYMSPEQADVSERDIDTRTDVYSLGAVLYEHELALLAENFLGSMYLRSERLDESEALYRGLLVRLQGKHGVAQGDLPMIVFNLGTIAAVRGDRERAIELIRQALVAGFQHSARDETGKLVGGHLSVRLDPHVASLLGDPEFEIIVGPGGYLDRLESARERVILGYTEQALPHLRFAMEHGYTNARRTREESYFTALHGHPEFEVILEEMVRREAARDTLASPQMLAVDSSAYTGADDRLPDEIDATNSLYCNGFLPRGGFSFAWQFITIRGPTS